MSDTPELLRVKLNAETAKVAWPELERHFARGAVVKVASSLDLVDVALAFAQDNKIAADPWLQAGMVAVLAPHGARDWAERQPELWAVVCAPWVLVQERRH